MTPPNDQTAMPAVPTPSQNIHVITVANDNTNTNQLCRCCCFKAPTTTLSFCYFSSALSSMWPCLDIMRIINVLFQMVRMALCLYCTWNVLCICSLLIKILNLSMLLRVIQRTEHEIWVALRTLWHTLRTLSEQMAWAPIVESVLGHSGCSGTLSTLRRFETLSGGLSAKVFFLMHTSSPKQKKLS
jgi:hypothetical protein